MDDMIRAVQPATKWKLLVVDSNSAKILNAVVKSHEVLQENVTVIEDMSQKRSSFPTYEAIYFVSPTPKIIDKIIADFKGEKPLYAAAHLFFLSSLEDDLFDKLKKSGTSKFIKTLKEMNIDFSAQEDIVFSLDMPMSLFSLYNPQSSAKQNEELEIIKKKLMSLLITLGDYPYIRFYDQNDCGNGMCKKLAVMVQKEMEYFKSVDSSYPEINDYKRAILIIVDRSFDMMAPFLHEFTYQAMMNDLICGDRTKQPGGITDPKYFLPLPAYVGLDETDSIWMTIRHWHFAESVEYILENFNKFLSENKAASAALGSSQPQGIEALSAMKDTLGALPQFQTLKAKYSSHITISQECKMFFEKRGLDMVALVQQDMATGETSEGKTVKNAMLDLIPVLSNPKTSVTDKLRTLIIYIISMNGIQDNERTKLLTAGNVSPSSSQGINNLQSFGVNLSSTSSSKEKGKYTYFGSYKKEKKKRKAMGNDLPYDTSRYVPLMKRLIEDQTTNSMPIETFPWVLTPPDADLGITDLGTKMFRMVSNGIVPPDPNHPFSLRTIRATWAGQTRAKTNDQTVEKYVEKFDLRRNGNRIILFSLGGLTYSEIRSAYEATKENQREVFIGSTFVYNPVQFIDILGDLHKAETILNPQPEVSMEIVEPEKEKKIEPEKEKNEKEKKGLFKKK